MLLALYLFLYFPIFYIAYLSLLANSVWPFLPLGWTFERYQSLMGLRDFRAALNSLAIKGLLTGVLSACSQPRPPSTSSVTFSAARPPGQPAAGSPVRRPCADRHLDAHVQPLGPHFPAISSPRSSPTRPMAGVRLPHSPRPVARYDSRLDEAAMVFGAAPGRTFYGDTPHHLASSARRRSWRFSCPSTISRSLSTTSGPRQPCRQSPGVSCVTAYRKSSTPGIACYGSSVPGLGIALRIAANRHAEDRL